jgi:hypothetical protein
MWTCNSIISWVLSRAGVDTGAIALPPRGRAPGWYAGVAVATGDAAWETPGVEFVFNGVSVTGQRTSRTA